MRASFPLLLCAFGAAVAKPSLGGGQPVDRAVVGLYRGTPQGPELPPHLQPGQPPAIPPLAQLAQLSGGQRALSEPKKFVAGRSSLRGEFVGTFLLGCAVACAGAATENTALAPLTPMAVISILTGLIYAFGPVSGAVYNPAAALALIMRGRMTLSDAVRFVGVEIAAATAAGVMGFLIYGVSAVPTILDPSTVAGLARAGLAEALFTFTIMTVVLHLGTTRAHADNDVGGLAIGLTIFGSAICASKISSACFNPSLAIGLYLSKALVGWSIGRPEPLDWVHPVLYSVAPLIGGGLAAAVFKCTLPLEP